MTEQNRMDQVKAGDMAVIKVAVLESGGFVYAQNVERKFLTGKVLNALP